MAACEEKIHISFGDADPAGVVFYPRALALAHQAVENFVRRAAIGWEAWFSSPVHAAPLRRAEADFLLPIRPGQILTTRTSVEKLGTSSVTFHVDFVDDAGRTAAVVRTTHVLVEKATGQRVPLSDEIRAAFQPKA